MAHRFQVGDRVQIIRTLADLPCGSIGTIWQVFPSCDFYDVRFEHTILARLVHHNDLQAAAPARAAPEADGRPGTTPPLE